ncbi:IclR family transcriptional regulator [Nocardioides acrostichi]|uniref:IclR family transcriptional regulator n=1 Tax=Nocardioides acrostichi TaxID=2784339 RepID=A0A930Y765_9ACTN|nr:IclR family transcriptional regulator [Nocardioides acrostichi]MBF4163100.1 IclR family transcriptional regulator [Nocardioides acrostichi]
MTAPHTVLGRAVSLLRTFSFEEPVLTLSELSRRTGLHKATAHRLCRELVEHRLLDRVPGGYRLSRGLFELGMRASTERTLTEVALPFLQDLYERTHETVHLGVREGSDVVYLLKIGGHRQARSPSRTGGRMPLHATAIGKMLLAHADPGDVASLLTGPLERVTAHTVTAPGILHRQLERALDEGVAFEHEESAPGLTCVAAPVTVGEDVVAAVSAAGPLGRFWPARHAVVVRAVAAAIGAALARRSTP